MRFFSFLEGACTIKAGEALTFVNTSDGPHYLCNGRGIKCLPDPNAPAQLDDVVIFAPGDSHSYVFAHAGTFTVTCIVHPGMTLTIIVTPR
jgi:plastocyanin